MTAPAARASSPEPPDRQHGAGRPQDVADEDGPGWPLERGRERRDGPLVVAAVAEVDELDLDPEPIAQREQRPEPARVLVARGQHAVARLPRAAR